MTPEILTWLVVTLLVLVVGALVLVLRRPPVEERVRDRQTERDRSLLTSTVLSPWGVGVITGLLLAFAAGLPLWIAGAIGVVAGVSQSIFLDFLQARRTAMLESHLAEGLDLMVSTLRAGGSLADALLSAARESGSLFRGPARELVERIRLGQDPGVVLADLESRVQLESFRLLTFALSAHWDGGGSLASTLSNVGRTVRDRVAVSRRVRSQAIETQVSMIGVLVITYGLALLMWKSYPDRVEVFATSELGRMLIGASILLQGVGLWWISRLTKIEV